MSPPRKVLLVGDYPPPAGGVATHVRQLHEFLRQQGVDARVLDIGKGGRPAPDVLPVRTARRLAHEVARHAREGFVVHLHTNGANPKSWAVVAGVGSMARAVGGRAMVTLHSGMLPDYLGRAAARRMAARAALLPYDDVVAVSPAVCVALAEAGVPAAQLSVHPAFLASAVRPGRAPAGFETARARRRPLLAYAHHPSAVYGQTLMWRAVAAAAEAHPELGVAVFGPGTEQPSFWDGARAAGVESRLEVFGELEHSRALALIAGSDVFVRPTLADGDAISVREALALGVACVASDVAVRPAGAVTFRSGDAKDLVEKLGVALSRPPRMGSGPDAGHWLLPRYGRLARAGQEVAEPAVFGEGRA